MSAVICASACSILLHGGLDDKLGLLDKCNVHSRHSARGDIWNVSNIVPVEIEQDLASTT